VEVIFLDEVWQESFLRIERSGGVFGSYARVGDKIE
jgi:hypothetical protein